MAKRKAKTPAEIIREQADTIRDSRARWLDALQNGLSDPTWSDGANMNLLRNHIIFAKRKIRELIAGGTEEPPEEFFWETPPYVDENFFVDPTSKRAARIISMGNRCCNQEIPASGKELKRFVERTKQSQLSLF